MAGGEESRCWRPQVLEPIYESAGEWDRVIAVYEVMQAHAEEPPRKVELLIRIAEIEERRLSHQNAAFDVYGRALRVDPTNQDVLGQLERLAAETGHWAEAGRALRRRAGEDRGPAPAGRSAAAPRRASTRRRPASPRRRSPTYRRVVAGRARQPGGAGRAGSPVQPRQQWDELADVVRREIRIAPERPGDRRADLPPGADLRAGADGPAQGRSRPIARSWSPIRRHAETRAALERMFMGGTMQLEIADVLEPLYRAGEEWEKLHQIYEVQLGRMTDVERAAGAAAPPGRDRRAEAGRSGRRLRLVGRGGQGGSVVGAGARRAAAPGARDAPVGRVRRHDVRGGVARSAAGRCGATCCCAWPRASRATSGDLERAEQALVQVLQRARRRIAAALASLDRIYESAGDVREPGGGPAPADRDHRRRRRSWSRCTCASAASTPRRWTTSSGAIASYLAVLEHESRSPEALDALERLYFRGERWRGAVRHLREAGRHRQGRRRRWPTATRAWPSWPPTRSTIAHKAVELWGRVRRPARRGRHRAVGPGRSARDGRRVEGADRGPREAGGGDRRTSRRRSRSTSASGRIWGEKLSRERNSLESWQKVLEIDPQDVDALRAIADELPQRGRLGGAVAGAAPPDPGRRSWAAAASRATELKELYSQLGELEGETLMRTQEAIDAWREVLELDRARLPRAGGAGEAVHAGGALGRGGRHPRAARAGAGQPDRAGRRPDAGRVAVGRQDRRRRLGGRGLRARAADRSRQHDRVASSWSSSIASARAG